MTIERVLPNQMSETEFFNLRRTIHGRSDIKLRITKIRAGLKCGCGPNCNISHVDRTGFTESHGRFCKYRLSEKTFVKCNSRGQAVASLVDDDATPVVGVMVLDGLFPHEESCAEEFRAALDALST